MTPEQIKLSDAVAAGLQLKPAPGFDGHWSRVFTLPDGGRLYFSAGRKPGTLQVYASVADNLRDHCPHYRLGDAPKTSINVSDTKQADRIAADIRRRLLPEHERDVAACTASKARHEESNSKRILALTKVAAPLGARVSCDDRTGDARPLSIDREGKFSVTATPYCDAVKIEIETSPDNGGKIAALLAAL